MSAVAGPLLVWRTRELVGAAAVVPAILTLGRAVLRDGIKGNRTAFLIAALVAVAAYSIVIARFFALTG